LPLDQAWPSAIQILTVAARSARLRAILADDVTFDGPDILTWFDLHTAMTGPLPTVNWRHVDNGKITAIRVIFDPRPLTSGN
jgi:hypothetical protein